MKPATQALKDFLLANRQVVFADTYTFVFSDGSREFYTNAQQSFVGIPPFDVIARTWQAKQVNVSGLRFHLGIGVEVDEQDVQLNYNTDAIIQGQGWRRALQSGQFDGARIQRDRFFFEAFGTPPIGSVPMFYGLVSSCDDIGRTEAKIKVKSDLNRLNVAMPRNLQQPSCVHTLFDSGCQLAKADFAVSGEIGADPTRSFIPWTGATAGEFDLGTVAVEVGPSLVQTRTIKHSDGTGLYLAYPLDYDPVEGMTISAWPGCDKTFARCTFFNNTANFKGFPFVPPAENAY